MSKHSRIAPSSAPMWRYCPGSVLAQEQYPEMEKSEAAREGDAAHWFAAGSIRDPAGPFPFVNKTAPNGVLITKEMADNANIYVSDVFRVRVSIGQAPHIEETIACPAVHEESFGTVDCWIYDPAKLILYIWDYKNGYGIVEPFENWQLINYYAGILDQLPNGVEQSLTVKFIIAQPKPFHPSGPIRAWTTSATTLRPYVNHLYIAAHEALSGKGPAVSGNHCRYCSARHACLSAEQAAYNAIDVADTSATMHELNPASLGAELAAIDRAQKALDYRRTGLEEQALAFIKEGQIVPGWSASSGRGRVTWNRPAAEIIAMAEILGVNISKPPEALTPKQAEKKGLNPDLVAAYSSAPKAKVKLIKDKGNHAKQIFGG